MVFRESWASRGTAGPTPAPRRPWWALLGAAVAPSLGVLCCFGFAICIIVALLWAPEDVADERIGAPGGIEIVFEGEWPPEARSVALHAVAVIGEQVRIEVPVLVSARWRPLGDDLLGRGGPVEIVAGFERSPKPETWYPVALAYQFIGERWWDDPDIRITINGDNDWYFGLDARGPDKQDNLLATILHEILHGMGFSATFDIDEGLGYWGDDNGYAPKRHRAHRHEHVTPRPRPAFDHIGMWPSVYDRFVSTGTGQALVSAYPNGSRELARALTGGNLFWSGAGPRTSGRPAARLSAPEEWDAGGSVSHLDDGYDDGPDAIMTSRGWRYADLRLGPVTLGMLADMGWTLR